MRRAWAGRTQRSAVSGTSSASPHPTTRARTWCGRLPGPGVEPSEGPQGHTTLRQKRREGDPRSSSAAGAKIRAAFSPPADVTIYGPKPAERPQHRSSRFIEKTAASWATRGNLSLAGFDGPWVWPRGLSPAWRCRDTCLSRAIQTGTCSAPAPPLPANRTAPTEPDQHVPQNRQDQRQDRQSNDKRLTQSHRPMHKRLY